MTKRLPHGKWLSDTTEVQYSRISGNWRKYFSRLRNMHGRKHLSVDDLMALYDAQNGLCALSGETLTCELVPGKISYTNASIDRILHGHAYEVGNIRLVCSIVNKMRWTMSDAELMKWSEKILANGKR